jgi:hypothetical protein
MKIVPLNSEAIALVCNYKEAAMHANTSREGINNLVRNLSNYLNAEERRQLLKCSSLLFNLSRRYAEYNLPTLVANDLANEK